MTALQMLGPTQPFGLDIPETRHEKEAYFLNVRDECTELLNTFYKGAKALDIAKLESQFSNPPLPDGRPNPNPLLRRPQPQVDCLEFLHIMVKVLPTYYEDMLWNSKVETWEERNFCLRHATVRLFEEIDVRNNKVVHFERFMDFCSSQSEAIRKEGVSVTFSEFSASEVPVSEKPTFLDSSFYKCYCLDMAPVRTKKKKIQTGTAKNAGGGGSSSSGARLADVKDLSGGNNIVSNSFPKEIFSDDNLYNEDLDLKTMLDMHECVAEGRTWRNSSEVASPSGNNNAGDKNNGGGNDKNGGAEKAGGSSGSTANPNDNKNEVKKDPAIVESSSSGEEGDSADVLVELDEDGFPREEDFNPGTLLPPYVPEDAAYIARVRALSDGDRDRSGGNGNGKEEKKEMSYYEKLLKESEPLALPAMDDNDKNSLKPKPMIWILENSTEETILHSEGLKVIDAETGKLQRKLIAPPSPDHCRRKKLDYVNINQSHKLEPHGIDISAESGYNMTLGLSRETASTADPNRIITDTGETNSNIFNETPREIISCAQVEGTLVLTSSTSSACLMVWEDYKVIRRIYFHVADNLTADNMVFVPPSHHDDTTGYLYFTDHDNTSGKLFRYKLFNLLIFSSSCTFDWPQ